MSRGRKLSRWKTLEILVRSCHRRRARYRDRSCEIGNLRQRTLESPIITEWFNSWRFINIRPSKAPGFKSLTLVLVQTMIISPHYHMRCQLLNPMKSLPGHSLGNLLVFLRHIKCRSNDDRFSVAQWESFIFSNLDVTTVVLLGPAQ